MHFGEAPEIALFNAPQARPRKAFSLESKGISL
jgi:hypothetical protein